MVWPSKRVALLACAVAQMAAVPAHSAGASAAPYRYTGRVSVRTIPLHRLLNRGIYRSIERVRSTPDAAAQPTAPVGPSETDAPYRTMCVRSCDGFYFPIREYARGRDIEGDARRCTATCGGGARLYYYPVRSGDIAAMRDLAGTPYASAPKAFAFRTTRDPACTCTRPAWSPEEVARHQSYAAEAIANPIANGTVAPVAQRLPDVIAHTSVSQPDVFRRYEERTVRRPPRVTVNRYVPRGSVGYYFRSAPAFRR